MHISDGILAPSVLIAGYGVAAGLTAIGLRSIKDRDYPLVGVMTAAFFVASLVRVPVPPTSVHLTLNSLVGIVLGIRCFPAILVALLLQAVLFGEGGLSTLGVNVVMMALPGYLAGTWMRWGLRRGGSGRVAFVLVLLPALAATAKVLSDALHVHAWSHAALSWPAAALVGTAVALALLGVDHLFDGGPVFRWGFAAGALAVLLSAAVLFCILSFAPLDRLSEREAFRDIARFAFLAHAPVIVIEGIMVALVLRYLAATRPSLVRGPNSLAISVEDR